MADLDIVRTTLADTSSLTRDVATPLAPLGYGADLSCASDLTEQMASVDPLTRLAVAEAIARRLTTPRGGVLDDPDYGLDLRAMCNRGMADDDVRTLAARVRSEVEKDDRVDAAAVVVTPSSDVSTLTIAIRVTPYDGRIGTFSLTLAVTSSSALIKEIAAG